MSGFQGFSRGRVHEIRVQRGCAQAQRGQEARLGSHAESGCTEPGSKGYWLRLKAARKLDNVATQSQVLPNYKPFKGLICALHCSPGQIQAATSIGPMHAGAATKTNMCTNTMQPRRPVPAARR